MDIVLKESERACGFTTHFRTVMGQGRARLLIDEDERRHGLDVLMRHHGMAAPSYEPEHLALTAVVAIEITSMTGKRHGLEAD